MSTENSANCGTKETITSLAATTHASTSASTDGNSQGKKVKRIRKSRKRAVQMTSKAGAKSSSTVEEPTSKGSKMSQPQEEKDEDAAK